MNEKLLQFAATFKCAAISIPEEELEDRAAAQFLGYVLGDTDAQVAMPPEYTPLQAILRGLRSCTQALAAPFTLHKMGDALYAHPSDANNPKFAPLLEQWTTIRQALWLSGPNQPVKMLDVVAAESAIHLLFDLIFNDYFIEDVDEDTLKAFHQYPELAKEMALDNLGELGLQGDASEEFIQKQLTAFNALMFICESHIGN